MAQKKEQIEYLPVNNPRTLMSRFMRSCVVGAIGFEPTTPGPPCQCATRLRHAPTMPGFHVRGNVSAVIRRSLLVRPSAVVGSPELSRAGSPPRLRDGVWRPQW